MKITVLRRLRAVDEVLGLSLGIKHTSGLKRLVVPSYLYPDAHHSGPSATRPRTFSAPSRRLPPESSEASELAISTRYQPHLWDSYLSILFSP